jgi:hypothetical protein
MKKLLLSLMAPFVLCSTLSAQITQEQADNIVRERMSGETKPYILYAKEEVQPAGYAITTAIGELLELDYPLWVYYVSYIVEYTNGKYLIVKEDNGNLLEVNTKYGLISEDLIGWTEWKVIMGNVCDVENPLTDLPWLKEIIDNFGNKAALEPAMIYLCTYRDGIGFLLSLDIYHSDPFVDLVNCDGEILCQLFGLGGELCEEYEIDFKTWKLIWIYFL